MGLPYLTGYPTLRITFNIECSNGDLHSSWSTTFRGWYAFGKYIQKQTEIGNKITILHVYKAPRAGRPDRDSRVRLRKEGR